MPDPVTQAATSLINVVEYKGADPDQAAEWLEALDQVIAGDGLHEAAHLLEALRLRANMSGVSACSLGVRPYVNTIPREREVDYPGDERLEESIEALIRYKALGMVAGANKHDDK